MIIESIFHLGGGHEVIYGGGAVVCFFIGVLWLIFLFLLSGSKDDAKISLAIMGLGVVYLLFGVVALALTGLVVATCVAYLFIKATRLVFS